MMKIGLTALAVCMCLMVPSVSMAKHTAANAMAEPPKLHCSGHGDAESMTMEEAEATPLFVMLQGKMGDPMSCAVAKSDGNEMFTVTFAKGATLKFTDNETLESAQEEVMLPAGFATISRDEAVKALKATEKDDEPKGMGVNWAKLMAPVPAGDADVVAEGKTCNAKAHVHYSGGTVTGFGFSSAC
jgi:hypothetical protein